MEKILTVKDLSVALEGKTVVKSVDFDLEKGEVLAIIGPNGSGKTVLLKTLLKEFRYTGEVSWAENIRLGYVPQKIDADRHLPLNLDDLLRAKAQILRLPASNIKSTMEAVGITKEILQTPVGHLSGGQFQKALIAFALLGKPNVLIFDEPTASIDQRGESEIYELIHRLQDKYDLTVILVSHDLSVVFRYATKVLCLNKTNICFGVPTEALTPNILEKLYGSPHKYYHHIHEHEHDTG